MRALSAQLNSYMLRRVPIARDALSEEADRGLPGCYRAVREEATDNKDRLQRAPSKARERSC